MSSAQLWTVIFMGFIIGLILADALHGRWTKK